jgi:hypothetical protein
MQKVLLSMHNLIEGLYTSHRPIVRRRRSFYSSPVLSTLNDYSSLKISVVECWLARIMNQFDNANALQCVIEMCSSLGTKVLEIEYHITQLLLGLFRRRAIGPGCSKRDRPNSLH